MQIPADSKVCPICEFEFPSTSKSFVWIAVILLLAFLLTLLNSLFHFL